MCEVALNQCFKAWFTKPKLHLRGGVSRPRVPASPRCGRVFSFFYFNFGVGTVLPSVSKKFKNFNFKKPKLEYNRLFGQGILEFDQI